MNRFLRLSGLVLVICAIYATGFLLFVESLPKIGTSVPRADGIVALTGGGARLDTAVSLLEHGAARRLLITGVYETTTREELGRRLHGGGRFACCADIDYDAEDTHDNAEQATDWTREHRYRSLIVVTARYHMPRSLLEFKTLMPDIRLIAYPVDPSRANMARWWSRPGTIRLLHQEYVKYLAALVVTAFHHEHRSEASQRTGLFA